MKRILPILADIANGIFATFLASWITGINPTWHFIVGIVFATLPDLDAIPELLKRGMVAGSSKYPHDHRVGLHYPIVFVIIGVVLIYLFPFFGWLFLVATMLHFVNDLYGTGWGVPILWPFKSCRYKFFGRRAALSKKLLIEKGYWNDLSDEERKLRFVVSWNIDELPEFIRRYRIENWIDIFYLHFSRVSLIEYLIFITAIILLLIHFF